MPAYRMFNAVCGSLWFYLYTLLILFALVSFLRQTRGLSSFRFGLMKHVIPEQIFMGFLVYSVEKIGFERKDVFSGLFS